VIRQRPRWRSVSGGTTLAQVRDAEAPAKSAKPPTREAAFGELADALLAGAVLCRQPSFKIDMATCARHPRAD